MMRGAGDVKEKAEGGEKRGVGTSKQICSPTFPTGVWKGGWISGPSSNTLPKYRQLTRPIRFSRGSQTKMKI